jgi:hypothetical protein
MRRPKHTQKCHCSKTVPASEIRANGPVQPSDCGVVVSAFRALEPVKSWRDLLPLRARNRSGSGAIVLADISEFYHSIYTHSISWALHTKSVAKANLRTRKPIVADRLLGGCSDNSGCRSVLAPASACPPPGLSDGNSILRRHYCGGTSGFFDGVIRGGCACCGALRLRFSATGVECAPGGRGATGLCVSGREPGGPGLPACIT